MKAYTDIEQSKKLAEILPLKSNDLWWNYYSVTIDNTTPQIIPIDEPWVGSFNWENKSDNVPCWSLAALLNLIPYATLSKQYNGKWNCTAYPKEETVTNCENAIDAAFELVVLLKDEETKMEE